MKASIYWQTKIYLFKAKSKVLFGFFEGLVGIQGKKIFDYFYQ
jgi:hypothetical protein